MQSGPNHKPRLPLPRAPRGPWVGVKDVKSQSGGTVLCPKRPFKHILINYTSERQRNCLSFSQALEMQILDVNPVTQGSE